MQNFHHRWKSSPAYVPRIVSLDIWKVQLIPKESYGRGPVCYKYEHENFEDMERTMLYSVILKTFIAFFII